MDNKYRYRKKVDLISNNQADRAGLPCGEINDEWVSCYNSDYQIKCCSDAKSGYIDKNTGTIYYSKYGFSCDYKTRCTEKNYHNPQQEFDLWMVIIIVVFVILFCIVIIILCKKDKTLRQINETYTVTDSKHESFNDNQLSDNGFQVIGSIP